MNAVIVQVKIDTNREGQVRMMISRPNSTPAYYQGRPAWLWITAMSPCRNRTASQYPN
jgi:hypothetical protein